MRLLAHSVKIVHRKGSLHCIPDALSRMYESETVPLNNVEEATDLWYDERVKVQKDPRKFRNWKVVKGQLYFRNVPDNRNVVDDNENWKIVLPSYKRAQVLEQCHDDPASAHLGINKTYLKVQADYFWPKMLPDIVKYVRTCKTCQLTKPEQKAASGLLGGRIIECPWDVLSTDVMEFPRSKNGMCYLVVFQDLFTKWIEMKPLKQATAKTISEAFEDLVLYRWGAPRVLISDCGTEYLNKIMSDLADEYGYLHSTSPPYTPRAEPTERTNRVLKGMIIGYLNQDHREWDVHLRDFRFAYNSAVHSATKFSPAFLNFG